MRPLLAILHEFGFDTTASCAGHECYRRRGDQMSACTEQGFVMIRLDGVEVDIHDGVLTLRWDLPERKRGSKKYLRRENSYSAYRPLRADSARSNTEGVGLIQVMK